MNPRPTNCDADTLTTTLSRRYEFFSRYKTLHCISSSPRGLQEVLFSFVQSFSLAVFFNALSEWFPFLNFASVTKLKRLYQAAIYSITSVLSSSLFPLLFSEAFLLFLLATLTHFALSSFEWTLRLPVFFPILDLVKLTSEI